MKKIVALSLIAVASLRLNCAPEKPVVSQPHFFWLGSDAA